MLRNGLSLGRRQLRQPVLSAITHTTAHDLPFVCNLCKTRGYSKSAVKIKAKPPRRQKGDTLLDQIKRLEAHVQQMERSYNEKLKDKAVDEVHNPLRLGLAV